MNRGLEGMVVMETGLEAVQRNTRIEIGMVPQLQTSINESFL